MDRDRIIPAREIEGLIANGHLIVIYEDCALKLDNWLDKHPGGHLAIHHVVGRDATDEMDAYVQNTWISSLYFPAGLSFMRSPIQSWPLS